MTMPRRTAEQLARDLVYAAAVLALYAAVSAMVWLRARVWGCG